MKFHYPKFKATRDHKREMARANLAAMGIGRDVDFHRLPGDQVGALLECARAWGYREPRNANGSRARYFCAYLQRLAR